MLKIEVIKQAKDKKRAADGDEKASPEPPVKKPKVIKDKELSKTPTAKKPAQASKVKKVTLNANATASTKVKAKPEKANPMHDSRPNPSSPSNAPKLPIEVDPARLSASSFPASSESLHAVTDVDNKASAVAVTRSHQLAIGVDKKPNPPTTAIAAPAKAPTTSPMHTAPHLKKSNPIIITGPPTSSIHGNLPHHQQPAVESAQAQPQLQHQNETIFTPSLTPSLPSAATKTRAVSEPPGTGTGSAQPTHAANLAISFSTLPLDLPRKPYRTLPFTITFLASDPDISLSLAREPMTYRLRPIEMKWEAFLGTVLRGLRSYKHRIAFLSAGMVRVRISGQQVGAGSKSIVHTFEKEGGNAGRVWDGIMAELVEGCEEGGVGVTLYP
jgi:hypothetical protein